MALGKRWLRDEPERERDSRYAYAPQRYSWPAEPSAQKCRREEYRRGWQEPQRIDPSYIWGNCH